MKNFSKTNMYEYGLQDAHTRQRTNRPPLPKTSIRNEESKSIGEELTLTELDSKKGRLPAQILFFSPSVEAEGAFDGWLLFLSHPSMFFSLDSRPERAT